MAIIFCVCDLETHSPNVSAISSQMKIFKMRAPTAILYGAHHLAGIYLLRQCGA